MAHTTVAKRGEFKIAISPYWEQRDNGVRKGLIVGSFGIHRVSKHGFTLSHLPSGMKLETYQSQHAARTMALRLPTVYPAVDWTLPNPIAAISVERRKAIINALREVL